MENFSFHSKAATLKQLHRFADLGIPTPYSFTVRQWQQESQDILALIDELFQDSSLAIRSSCTREDSGVTSGAGAFLSMLNVPGNEKDKLQEAIDRVIASYGEADEADEVLIQPMVENPALTGVIMTRSLSDGSPYYVINYDDESGRTDTITGGTTISKTVYVYRNARDNDFDSPRLRAIVQLARRIEELCESDSLDMEFCLDAAGVLHLLQVRPICASSQWDASAPLLNNYIKNVARFVASRTGGHIGLYGARSILGIMPDWNPAEMIGILPRHLDTSLYRELITSRVWASARGRLGYNIPPTCELMVLLAGHPYIDVRLSFNSFLPKDLDPVTSEALVSAWLEYLASHPQFHDKIEFEVAQTCMDFCFDSNLDNRYPGLLTSSRRLAFRNALVALTARAMSNEPGNSMDVALERITELRARQTGRPLYGRPQPLVHLADLLAECRKYGTLPFSILARHAFIAETLLKTAIIRGALQPERVSQFKRGIRTISGELSRDFLEVYRGTRTGRSFMEKYGHLRPGSYNILSPRYADRLNIFDGPDNMERLLETSAPFELTSQEKADLGKLLAEAGLPGDSRQLLRYAEQAIAGRELAKFVFSRNLSDALETIASWAEDMGFGREGVSLVPVQALLDLDYQVGVTDSRSFFGELIARNREEYEKWRTIKLGYLIRSEGDIYIVPQHRAAPNFIGSKKIEAPIVCLRADSPESDILEGRIVVIENADPGFDWIFTRNIAGLVTKFGGANSHMAIRCAEYGLPAAIGVGEQLFELIANGGHATLNPANSLLKRSGQLC